MEEDYIEIPLDFRSIEGGNKVCRLKKALYRQKQTPCAWFGRLTQVIIYMGYQESQGDEVTIPCSSNIFQKVNLLYFWSMWMI